MPIKKRKSNASTTKNKYIERRRFRVQGQHWQKVTETPPQPIIWAWWNMTVNPATL
jgi:hypothetical protein